MAKSSASQNVASDGHLRNLDGIGDCPQADAGGGAHASLAQMSLA